MENTALKKMEHSNFEPIKNAKSIGNETNKIEISDISDFLTYNIDVSIGAVNEYAKSILGRYPKNNIEFSNALQAKVLEESKMLADAFKEIRNET